MKSNIGAPDRVLRIAVGILLVVVGVGAGAGFVSVEPIIGVLALLAGIVLVVTGSLWMCPIYKLVGVDTSGK